MTPTHTCVTCRDLPIRPFDPADEDPDQEYRPKSPWKIHPKSLETHKNSPRCGKHWRAWRDAQRAKRSEYGRKKNYALDPDDRAACIEEQGGVCPLCLRNLDSAYSKRQSPTDHDHGCCKSPPTCGECTRGITCSWCNKNLLGSLHLSPGEELAVARRVVAYLEDPPMQRVRRRRELDLPA